MSKICSIFVFWLCQHAVFASVEYALVSSTTSGEPCLNTCKNGQCFVFDYRLKSKPCFADPVAGVPIYYTALKHGTIRECLSNCAKFGYRYEWCYTTESYYWDYCSSKLKGPSNVHGYDIYGNRCIDDCVRTEYSSSFCHTEVGTFDTCAVPARLPVQSCLNLFSNTRVKRSPLDKIFSPALCSQTCRRIVRDGRDGEAQDRIDRIYNSGMTVQNVTSFLPNSPYSFVATTNATNSYGDDVYLPLIVQATLRQIPVPVPRQSSDISPAARNNINHMYNGMVAGIDVGHIIGFQNGGTRDLFNYVGQTAALNRGPYKVVENEINSWINFGGTAELTVVITYIATIPEEFTVKLKLFNADGSLHSDCLDIVMKNI